MNIYREIQEFRKIRGWSQAELAKNAKVSLPSVQLIESGRGNPSWNTLNKLLEALGLSLILEHTDLMRLNEFLENPSFKNDKLFMKSLELEMQSYLGGGLSQRETDTLVSALVALRDHYPTWLKLNRFLNTAQKIIMTEYQTVEPNRLIKFRRLWLSVIPEVFNAQQ